MDNNVEAVCAKLRQRAEVGLNKYGVGTDKAGLSPEGWIKHAQEEAMDFCVYLEALSATLRQPDTEYVCVRREELERVNEFIAREQAADFEDEDDKCEQSEGAREICERALGTHHGKRLLRDW